MSLRPKPYYQTLKDLTDASAKINDYAVSTDEILTFDENTDVLLPSGKYAKSLDKDVQLRNGYVTFNAPAAITSAQITLASFPPPQYYNGQELIIYNGFYGQTDRATVNNTYWNIIKNSYNIDNG